MFSDIVKSSDSTVKIKDIMKATKQHKDNKKDPNKNTEDKQNSKSFLKKHPHFKDFLVKSACIVGSTVFCVTLFILFPPVPVAIGIGAILVLMIVFCE